MDDGRHRALVRGVRILESVAESRSGLTVTELAELTGADKSSVSRLVTTLVDLGFLARLENRKIVLTGRILSLSKGFRQQYNLSEIARPHLTELLDRVNETVILTIREGNFTVSIDQLDPEHPFRMVPHVGNAAPMYATAAGRAILFALPVSEQHRIIDELRDAPVEHPEVRLDRDSWARELELARTRGFVWIPRSDDVERIAALAHDRNGGPLAAVSVYGPRYRMHERIADLGREARSTAGRISRAAYGIRPGEEFIA
ncbi:IclR family transcriptional regulator [Jiangella endophytica]|uniref:IclR family transcriptional regulator n=1 Tax=Jiangella endophytica TaxID=1623398 RepID=UPI0018E53DC5|nr:IclR family transcriptional regulator [Jiangella endophytica]